MIAFRQIYFLPIFLLLSMGCAFAQSTTVNGKVIDAASGDPIPFANVHFKNTEIGTTTDFNGAYSLTTNKEVDSLTVSYIGYISKTKPLTKKPHQTLDFQLQEDIMSLDEVVFVAGENPAFEIMRNVVRNKNKNDKRSLEAYQHETYTKIEIDVDNITERFRQRKIMQKITRVMDSVEQIAGEDGKPVLPIFISETLSEYYFRSSPTLRHEKIIKSKITGVGIEDGTLVSQFIGSSFQEYNFYQNWLNIVSKEFISPIADGWKLFYEYDLTDSAEVDGHYCYKLDFFPKSEQDLAFVGIMWITKNEYALKRIDATVTGKANLNYVEKIKIQQELAPTDAGAWLPVQNRVLLDIGEVTKNMAGVLAKFYTSNQNIQVNQPKDLKFYARPIEVAEDFKVGSTDDYWNMNRHVPLTNTELSVYKMIDTLRTIPIIKTYTELLKVAINGYFKAGKIDLGPYLSVYANNSVEGNRFHLGARTNIDFSDKIILGGYVAYGTKDEDWKYKAFTEYIFDRTRWSTVRLEYTHDLDQVGLAAEDLINSSVFLTATRFGELIRPYYYDQAKFTMQRELFKGYRQKIIVNYRSFEPIYNFAYYTDPGNDESQIKTDIESAELTFEARYAKNELFIQNDNERVSLGTLKWPVFTFRYTHGFKGVLGSDFEYNRVSLNISDDLNLGLLGTSRISITGEHIFETLPYPLLKTHIGNESVFYTSAAFNLMNYSEFANDSYISFSYDHFFQGFILNRIPLMKKLKWRLLATADILYGDLSQANRDIIPAEDASGNIVEPIGGLSNEPYIELGYGVENILKILRVDFIHRLNYLDRPGIDRFGAKFSFQFIL